jgi:hypothetical protein
MFSACAMVASCATRGLVMDPASNLPIMILKAGQIGQLKNLIWTSLLFPWENSLGFFLAGDVGHDFVAPYSVTLDFSRMLMRFSQNP